MALYLGSEKVKVNLDSIVYCLNLYSTTPSIVNDTLLSSDNYILQDSAGIYLIPKIEIEGVILTTVDDYVLQDINGLYLTIKEDI